jgi:hypothetical protein
VNDISREVGGTLGVAVSGSVFVSLYTPAITDRFESIPGLIEALPTGLYDAAKESVGAAYGVAQGSPEAVRSQVIGAVSDSFMRGFSVACTVVAVAALLGSIAALALLPARPSDPA